jgi:hypothetical protein
MGTGCATCGANLRPGTARFADRTRLPDGRLVCSECALAARAAARQRGLSDLEAAVRIDPDRRVDMGVGAALFIGNEHLLP